MIAARRVDVAVAVKREAVGIPWTMWRICSDQAAVTHSPPPPPMAADRRGPGGRGAGIEPAAIVAAALALMDEHGVEWLTMRRLAAALDVAPGALYWHFANKAALLAAVMNEVSASLSWPDGADSPGTARDRLTSHLQALRRHWRRHPALVSLGRHVRPAESGEFTAVGVRLLTEMGLPADEARACWRSLVWLVLGFFFVEGSVAGSAHHAPVAGEPGRYEVALGDAPEVVDTDVLFERSLALMLDGIEAGT